MNDRCLACNADPRQHRNGLCRRCYRYWRKYHRWPSWDTLIARWQRDDERRLVGAA